MKNCRDSAFTQWVGSGAASLSAAHVRNMWCTAERRFVRHVCLRNPFPPLSKLPEAWGTWELHHLIQRSRGFGHGVVVPCDYCCRAASLSAAHVCKMWRSAKRDSWDMFVSGIHSRHSFLEFHSKHPIPTRSLRFLRAAAHNAHPFVAAEVKNLSHAEKQRVWSRSCLQGFVTYNAVIVSKIWITGY